MERRSQGLAQAEAILGLVVWEDQTRRPYLYRPVTDVLALFENGDRDVIERSLPTGEFSDDPTEVLSEVYPTRREAADRKDILAKSLNVREERLGH